MNESTKAPTPEELAALPGVPLAEETYRQPHHNELVLPARGKRIGTYLRYVDFEHGALHIPVGSFETMPREELGRTRRPEPGHRDNILVPLIPLRYTEPGHDKGKAALLRPGYLYVFRDGHLWRELEVRLGGQYRDVNLSVHAGQDQRPASGEADQVVVVPAKVDKRPVALEIAYAEVQWSWSRINDLGGMAEDDIRLAHANHSRTPPVPMPEAAQRAGAEKRRAGRLQRIDLTGYPAGFPYQAPRGRSAAIENILQAVEIPLLEMIRELAAPVVYVDDPLGIAEGFAGRWRAIAEEHRRLAGRMTGRLPRNAAEAKRSEAERRLPFETALLAYHAFYNAATLAAPGADGTTSQTDGEKALAEAAGRLDHALIYDHYLAGAARRDLRERLRRLREAYVGWLARQDGAEAPAVSLFAALRDYATLPAPDYIRLWAAANGVLQPLLHDPTTSTHGIDLPRDAGPSTTPPGVPRYIATVLAPDSPWQRLLYPTPAQQDVHTPLGANLPRGSAPAEPPDPDGRFRPQAFVLSLHGAERPGHHTAAVLGILGLAKSIVADHIKSLGKAAAQAGAGSGDSLSVLCLVRLAFATREADLQGLSVAGAGSALQGQVIVSGEARLAAALGAGAPPPRYQPPPATPTPPASVPLVDPHDGGRLIGHIPQRELPDNDGGTPRLGAATLRAAWVDEQGGDVARLRADLIVAPRDSRYARKYTGAEAEAGAEGGHAAWRVLGTALPPIVAALEWVNAWQAWTTLRNSSSYEEYAKNGASLATALLASLYATLEAADKSLPEALKPVWVEELAKKQFRVRGTRILAMDAFGAGAVFLNAVMQSWSAVDAFRRDEAGLGVAQGVAALFDFSLSGVLIAKGVARRAGEQDAAAGAGEEAVAAGGSEEAAAQAAGAAGTAVAEEAGGEALSLLGSEAVLGPLGWALMAGSLLAMVAAYCLRDTELDYWAGHGPFAKVPDERRSGTYAGQSWRELYTALAGLLLRPRVRLNPDPGHGYYSGPRTTRRRRDDVLVEVIAPGWRPGRGVLDIQATRQRLMSELERARYETLEYLKIEYGDGMLRPAQHATLAALNPGQQPVPPYLCTWRYDPSGQHVIGLTYHYRGPDDSEHDYRWYARARHITPAQVSIPPRPAPDARQSDPVTIDPDTEGWAYATPLKVPAR